MIAFTGVHKSFGPKQVLRGFTLDVNDGETMVIIGFSGTGKSVAIKHVVGLLDPDAGHVSVDGMVVDTLGRVESGSPRVLSTEHEQFAASVRAILPKYRFLAAEAGGHRVRQLVRLPFRFSLNP